MTLPETKDWVVADAREGKTEPNPHGGTFTKWYVDFEGCRDVYWRRRTGDDPEIGQSYYGTISKGTYGPIFKKEKVPDGHRAPGGSQRPSQPSSGKSEPHGGWDAKEARIERQAALKIVAPLILEERGLHRTTKEIVKEIEAFVHEAGQEGSAGEQPVDFQGARRTEPQTQIGEEATPPSEFPDAEKDLADFRELLSAKGVANVDAREHMADYFQQVLLPEKRTEKLIKGLQGDSWGIALDKLAKETESWRKIELGDLDVDPDPVPF